MHPKHRFPSEFASYYSAYSRCTFDWNNQYKNYGMVGVTFHEGWLGEDGFLRFIADIGGAKPTPKHSVDRIDGTKNYEPGNVRWATSTEQNRNKSNSKIDSPTIDRLHTLADMFCIQRRTVMNRYRDGERGFTKLLLRGKPRPRTRVAVENRANVSRMFRQGLTRTAIAHALDLHLTTVVKIVKELKL